jgi:hypothetical protein
MGVDDVVLYPFVPFPGSVMHDKMVQRGELKLNNFEDYHSYIEKVSTYSIVAVNNRNIDYKVPIHTTSLYVMLVCYIISIVRRPSRFFMFFYRVVTRNPIGVFEVAMYQYLYWNKVVVKCWLEQLFSREDK